MMFAAPQKCGAVFERGKPMEKITWEGLAAALAAISALAALLAVLWQGWEAFRKLAGTEERRREKRSMQAGVAALEGRVSDCEARLQRGETRFREMRADNTQILNVLNAMMMHLITGNDHDRLRDVKRKLDSYLTKR